MKALPVVTACIVIISVIAYYYLGAPGHKSGGMKDEGGRMKTEGELHPSSFILHPFATASRGDFTYPIDGTRDPFQQMPATPDTGEPPGTSITLTGIIWDKKNPAAIIVDSNNNSYVVRAGEEINKAKILAIQPNGIVIEKDGKRQELILWSAKL